MGAAVLVAMVHVLVVSHRYFVGSFDDDANYILTGRALLDGRGLAGYLPSGDSVVAGYPPGYPALLVPLLWLFPHTFVPLQLFSAGCFAVTFPLSWYYLDRRGYPDAVRVAVMVLMSLNPVLATFGSMVMAEMPFICCLLVFLIAADRWEADDRVWSPVGVLVVALGAELVWLKEAGIGMTLGFALWLALRRRWAKAVAVAVALVVLLVPVVVARVIDHVPLAGSRYSEELGVYYSGGLVDRLIHVVPSGLWQFLCTALPRSVVATGVPLPQFGVRHFLILVVWWQIPIFAVLGLVVAVARHRDAGVLVVPAYLAETLLWPEVNERRVILAAPIVLAWYALGVRTAAGWILSRARRLRPGPRPAAATMALLGVAAVVVPLVVQFPRDYLFGLHQDSSRPEGSRYMAVLSALGDHEQVVETDYKYTTALFSGHRTADNAFLAEIARSPTKVTTSVAGNVACSPSVATASLAADGAGYLLIGAVNKPLLIDNPCLFSLATTRIWAVRLLRTSRDQASVFELIGPGTAHPDLVDLTAAATLSGSGGLGRVPVRSAGTGDHPGSADTTAIVGGTGSLSWSFGGDRPIAQVSVGEVGTTTGATQGVDLQIEEAGPRWVTVAAAPRAVGDDQGASPFLLATLPPGTRARAVRVVVHGSGQAIALDVNALGPGRVAPSQ